MNVKQYIRCTYSETIAENEESHTDVLPTLRCACMCGYAVTHLHLETHTHTVCVSNMVSATALAYVGMGGGRPTRVLIGGWACTATFGHLATWAKFASYRGTAAWGVATLDGVRAWARSSPARRAARACRCRAIRLCRSRRRAVPP